MTLQTDDSRTNFDAFYLTRIAEAWPANVKKFEELQNMPNAYFGVARDGCYAPYRLSEVCQDWVSAKDLVKHFSYTTSAGMGIAATIPLPL